VLGYLVSGLVVVQAAMIVWGVSGLFRWIAGGGVLDAATLEERGEPHFTEELGFAVHALNGTFLLPAVGLALLIVSFFTRDRRAMELAGLVVVLILVQQQLGFIGSEIPVAGAFHGINALLLFSVAALAGRRMGKLRASDRAAPAGTVPATSATPDVPATTAPTAQ